MNLTFFCYFLPHRAIALDARGELKRGCDLEREGTGLQICREQMFALPARAYNLSRPARPEVYQT